MNREIKFRARNNKYWIYCDAIINGWAILNENGGMAKINPETVGQYTGLKDKNGKEIYEGDVIEFSYDVFTGNFDTKVGRGTIEFIDGAFYIKPFEIEGKKIKDIDNEEWFLIYTVNIDTLKVIGNIYDNPELLGGE